SLQQSFDRVREVHARSLARLGSPHRKVRGSRLYCRARKEQENDRIGLAHFRFTSRWTKVIGSASRWPAFYVKYIGAIQARPRTQRQKSLHLHSAVENR